MKKNKKIAIVLGTRPEIIKLSPVIRACLKEKLDFFIVHTNQHYSASLDRLFFKELDLPNPDYNLNAGLGLPGDTTGKMLSGVEKVLMKEKPAMVLVQGDTNSVLAGALAASRMHIPVGHVEAGLRSYDNSMPEEINRKLTDQISELLFVPTKNSANNLKKEGIGGSRVLITGNTIVDALKQNFVIAKEKSKILNTLSLLPGKFFLITLHRQENVDSRENFSAVLSGIEKVIKTLENKVIWPIHPRAGKMLKFFKLSLPKGLMVIDPVGYFDFLVLEAKAGLIFTDSGGVQEESCILNTPCVTLRNNTERPETITAGANFLAGTRPESIVKAASFMSRQNKKKWESPFGSGNAGIKIIHAVKKYLSL